MTPVKFEGDVLVNPLIVDRVERSLLMLVGNLYPYIQPESLSIHKKVEIRHLWRQGSDPLRPVEDRPDLDIDFDLDDWRNSLSYYLTRMSAIHDPGKPPSVSGFHQAHHRPVLGSYVEILQDELGRIALSDLVYFFKAPIRS